MGNGRVPGPLGAQEPTLSELEANPPPFIESGSLKWFDPQQLEKMTDEKREEFFVDRLGKYENQVYESAANNKIPPQLLAAVILNELADIHWTDIAQDAFPFSSGSLGIAQILVSTAVRHNLVPGQLINTPGPLQSGPANPAVVANRLRIPQFAIEGAARYIRIILEKICANTDKPWVKRNRFTLTNFNQIGRAQDIYNYLSDHPQEVEREATLARLVAAVYNSEDIVIAQKPESVDESQLFKGGTLYWQAIVHGNNAANIARSLYKLKLFRR